MIWARLRFSDEECGGTGAVCELYSRHTPLIEITTSILNGHVICKQRLHFLPSGTRLCEKGQQDCCTTVPAPLAIKPNTSKLTVPQTIMTLQYPNQLSKIAVPSRSHYDNVIAARQLYFQVKIVLNTIPYMLHICIPSRHYELK